jgi:YVTN family beta-propeller protein
VPSDAVYDEGRGEVFVSNEGSNSVSVISDLTNNVVATIAVGGFPFSVSYDNNKGEIYVAEQNSKNVSVISDVTNTVVSTFQVGNSPYGEAYDFDNGYTYVTNSAADTLSIISPGSSPTAYPIKFTETGLSSGTSWSIVLNGVDRRSSSAMISIAEYNGTYTYTVEPVEGYSVNQSSEPVVVEGAIQRISVTFTPQQTFFGLPGLEGNYVLGVGAIAVLLVGAVWLRALLPSPKKNPPSPSQVVAPPKTGT